MGLLDKIRGKPGPVRNADGTYAATTAEGKNTSAMNKNMKVLGDTLENAYGLVNTINNGALEQLNSKIEFQNMMGDIAQGAGGDGKIDFEQMMMATFMQIMQNQQNNNPQTVSTQATSAGVTTPAPVAPVNQFKDIIDKVVAAPDKLISEKIIGEVVKSQGIEPDKFKTAIKKLSKIYK